MPECPWQDSNLQPPVPETGTLSIALQGPWGDRRELNPSTAVSQTAVLPLHHGRHEGEASRRSQPAELQRAWQSVGESNSCRLAENQVCCPYTNGPGLSALPRQDSNPNRLIRISRCAPRAGLEPTVADQQSAGLPVNRPGTKAPVRACGARLVAVGPPPHPCPDQAGSRTGAYRNPSRSFGSKGSRTRDIRAS